MNWSGWCTEAKIGKRRMKSIRKWGEGTQKGPDLVLGNVHSGADVRADSSLVVKTSVSLRSSARKIKFDSVMNM